jgi:hypothetical protein
MFVNWVVAILSFIGFMTLTALISYGARLEQKIRSLEKEKENQK